MNNQLILSLLAGTSLALCSTAQEEQVRRQNFQRTQPSGNEQGQTLNQQRPLRPQPEGIQGECPMHGRQSGQEGQGPMMRGPLSEAPGQMPLMRGMANQGQQMPGEPSPRRLFANPEALKAAGATDEQIQTFRKFMLEQRLKQIDLNAAVEKAQLKLQILESDPSSDEATMLKATEEVSKAQAEQLRAETLMKTKPKSIFGEEVVKKLLENSQRRQPPQMQQQPQQGPGVERPVQRRPNTRTQQPQEQEGK